MISKLTPYSAYQDSGVSWLGEIPAHWEIRKLGTLGTFYKGRGISKADITETGVPAITYGDIYTQYGVEIKALRRCTSLEVAVNAQKILNGDLLFTASGETIEDIGKTTLYTGDTPGYAGGDIIILRPDQGEGLYLSYVLNSDLGVQQKSAFGRGDIIVHISASKLKQVAVPVPPLSEQAAIARFLDHVDRRIRRYIRAQRKLIALLEEQKQAIIHRAVTRGLDPDVRLKPSGVEWLGEIPEHWELKRAKYYLCEVNERSTTGEEELLSVSHITGVTPRSQKNITMFMASSYIGHKLCQPGDLAVNTMWVWMGALGIAKQTGIVSPSYSVYRLLSSGIFTPDYLDKLLRTKPYVSEYIWRSTGIRSSRLRVYPEEFLKIRLIRPPYDEQERIVEAIEQKTRHVDQTIAQTQHEIDLIREYRTRLIADVVTGKLDVRQAAAHLPEEAEEPEELDELEEMDEDGAAVDDGPEEDA